MQRECPPFIDRLHFSYETHTKNVPRIQFMAKSNTKYGHVNAFRAFACLKSITSGSSTSL